MRQIFKLLPVLAVSLSCCLGCPAKRESGDVDISLDPMEVSVGTPSGNVTGNAMTPSDNVTGGAMTPGDNVTGGADVPVVVETP